MPDIQISNGLLAIGPYETYNLKLVERVVVDEILPPPSSAEIRKDQDLKVWSERFGKVFVALLVYGCLLGAGLHFITDEKYRKWFVIVATFLLPLLLLLLVLSIVMGVRAARTPVPGRIPVYRLTFDTSKFRRTLASADYETIYDLATHINRGRSDPTGTSISYTIDNRKIDARYSEGVQIGNDNDQTNRFK